jgi:F-type H+-transporting ATPase subunit delta
VADERLIDGYAQALFAVADAEGVLPTVEEELYGFARALESDTKLREALTDAALPAENKKAVIHDLLGQRANPVTVNVLGFAIDAGRARELPHIIDALVRRAAEGRQHRLAEVRTAVPLTAQQRDRLGDALASAMGGPVDVRVVVDPSVVGGMVARVGDEVLDGSIRSRLDEARQRLGS